MPPVPSSKAPVLLVCGDDDFGVKERARQVFRQWSAEIGGMDHEIIDASASHSGEALAVLARLRAALQTLPFFGSGKAIWLQNCNFLGEERAAEARAVTEDLKARLEDLVKSAGGTCSPVNYELVDKLKTSVAESNCRANERFGGRTYPLALLDVLTERHRQDKKWGVQVHDPVSWLVILGEEFGEVAKAICEKDEREYRKELVQVAAVAVAAVEEFDRRCATLAPQEVHY